MDLKPISFFVCVRFYKYYFFEQETVGLIHIWEKAISILVEILSSGLSYLITAITLDLIRFQTAPSFYLVRSTWEFQKRRLFMAGQLNGPGIHSLAKII